MNTCLMSYVFYIRNDFAIAPNLHTSTYDRRQKGIVHDENRIICGKTQGYKSECDRQKERDERNEWEGDTQKPK